MCKFFPLHMTKTPDKVPMHCTVCQKKWHFNQSMGSHTLYLVTDFQIFFAFQFFLWILCTLWRVSDADHEAWNSMSLLIALLNTELFIKLCLVLAQPSKARVHLSVFLCNICYQHITPRDYHLLPLSFAFSRLILWAPLSLSNVLWHVLVFIRDWGVFLMKAIIVIPKGS